MAEPPWRVDPPLRVDPEERLRPASSRRQPRGPARREQRGKRPWRNPGGRSGPRFLRRFWMLTLLLILWCGIIGGDALGYFALTLPDTSQLTVAARRPSVTILAEDGSLVASFGDLFGQPVTLKEMSPTLPQAVIAT